MQKAKLTLHSGKKSSKNILEDFDIRAAKKALGYHKGYIEYKETPLVNLENLAKKLGVKKIYVKDESYRFGLNAFKILGGSYAVGTHLANMLGKDISALSVELLKSEKIKNELGNVTFITATDGNHGRSIAWAANQLNQKAVVYMPKGAVYERIKNITDLGASVNITELNFDDTARLAFEESKKNNWIMTQDTTFDGYYDFPKWCMQGYLTMSYEIYKKLENQKEKPTHIFIQAGAGSFAGSVVGFFSSVYGEDHPIITVIEAENCDCYRRTVEANDGKTHKVSGDLETIMAGLSVGEPCSIGWDVLSNYADAFAVCNDGIAAKGMRVLAAPKGDDRKIVSGESGAVGLGYVVELLTDPDMAEMKKILKIDENSTILCFSTEGDTDPENYEKIVWDGLYPIKKRE